MRTQNLACKNADIRQLYDEMMLMLRMVVIVFEVSAKNVYVWFIN